MNKLEDLIKFAEEVQKLMSLTSSFTIVEIVVVF